MNTTSQAEPLDLGPVVGVSTTRIYCRQRCRPGRAPRPENCRPFLNAAAARASGYRPCKQCRPDDPSAGIKPSQAIRYGMGLTPVGVAFVAATEQGVCALYLFDDDDPSEGLKRLRDDFPGATIEADQAVPDAVLPLVNAFVNDGQPCDDLRLDLHGSPFQRKVWTALQAIPRGTTTTYGEIAKAIGLATGTARAVGTACGANSVALLVPCHRVVRAGSGLGGYHWGLKRKEALLAIEQDRSVTPKGQSSLMPGILIPASRTAVP